MSRKCEVCGKGQVSGNAVSQQTYQKKMEC